MSTSRDDFGIAIRSALLQRGARQKFSLFFLLCLSLIIFFLDIYPNKFMDKIRIILNDGVYRTSSIINSPLHLISLANDKIKIHWLTQKENKELKKKLSEFQEKEFQIEFLTTENKKLKEILDTSEIEKSSNILAKVLLDKESPFLKSLIINRGSSSGIIKGMPVLEGNNLVGRIVEVNYLSARVLLLNDLNSKIPAVIGPSSTQAIVSGTGDQQPILEYLPTTYIDNGGNTVFTSGKDGIFDAGIAIGKTIIEDNNVVKVELFADSNQLSFVNINLKKIKENNF